MVGKIIAMLIVIVILFMVALSKRNTIVEYVPALKPLLPYADIVANLLFGATNERHNILASCPPGYRNTPEGCTRDEDIYNARSSAAKCPPTFENRGSAGCVRPEDEYTAPSIAATCPPGYSNMGPTGCRRPGNEYAVASRKADCPTGYTNNGPAGCGRGSDDYSASNYVRDCPNGYKNSGFGTCIPRIQGRGVGFPWKLGDTAFSLNEARMRCHYANPQFLSDWNFIAQYNTRHSTGAFMRSGTTRNKHMSTWPRWIEARLRLGIVYWDQILKGHNTIYCEKNGEIIYPKCPPGMTNDGCCICRTSGPASRTDFKPCPAGYRNHTAGLCRKICKAGYSNTGFGTCHRPVSTKGPSAFTCPKGWRPGDGVFTKDKCYQICADGYNDNGGGKCVRPVDLRKEIFTCPSNRSPAGDRCLAQCKPDYSNTGEACNRPTKNLGSTYFTCPDILEPDGDRCRVKCRDLYSNTGESCKRPKSVLSDSSFDCPSHLTRGTGDDSHKCYGSCPEGWETIDNTCKEPNFIGKLINRVKKMRK